jgi:hypothetical protein
MSVPCVYRAFGILPAVSALAGCVTTRRAAKPQPPAEAWGLGAAWRFLIGRYNYSVHLPRVELSSLPSLHRTNFHLREGYGMLRLQPPAAR